MSCVEWAAGPFGWDAAKGQTNVCQRTVLVVVHHVTAGTRLADVVPMLESDRRVQVVFTWARASVFSGGVAEFLARLGGVVLPWQQAAQVRFDLAVAASYGLLERLHAPVVTLSHGVGVGRYTSRWDGPGPRARREGAGAARARLTYHGRVVPARIIVAADRQLAALTRSCPEAAPVAPGPGDPCYDRLAASLPSRARYRRALGAQRTTLVAVTSTWGKGSLLQRHRDLLARLAGDLPPERYRVAAIVHPNVWSWHGPRQVRAWYADGVRRGLILVPPEDGWRAVLAAADVAIGDHGSVTCYAASAGVPVLLASCPAGEAGPGSPVSVLARTAPRLCPAQPVAPQLTQATAAWSPGAHAAVRAAVTAVPGQAARLIRTVMYRLMNLAEPAAPPPVCPVPVPAPARIPGPFGEAR